MKAATATQGDLFSGMPPAFTLERWNCLRGRVYRCYCARCRWCRLTYMVGEYPVLWTAPKCVARDGGECIDASDFVLRDWCWFGKRKLPL